MIERPYVKNGKDNGHLIMTEAPVSVTMLDGRRRKCPAGTMFHVTSAQKTPPGMGVDGYTATEAAGYHNIFIHWNKLEDGETIENEVSLRKRIVKAENQRWWWRSLLIGSSGGAAIKLLSLLPGF